MHRRSHQANQQQRAVEAIIYCISILPSVDNIELHCSGSDAKRRDGITFI